MVQNSLEGLSSSMAQYIMVKIKLGKVMETLAFTNDVLDIRKGVNTSFHCLVCSRKVANPTDVTIFLWSYRSGSGPFSGTAMSKDANVK